MQCLVQGLSLFLYNQIKDHQNELQFIENDQTYKSTITNGCVLVISTSPDQQVLTFPCFAETLKLVNSTGDGSGNLNADEVLNEAKKILEELRARNFTSVKDASDREKEAARNASAIADKLKEQANAINERAGKFNNTFKDLLEAFKHLRKESGLAKEKSANASGLIKMAKDVDWKVCFHILLLIRVQPLSIYKSGSRVRERIQRKFK